MNTEREQAYWDRWDEPALHRIIIQQQRKITEASKKYADSPQLHKPHGALDTSSSAVKRRSAPE